MLRSRALHGPLCLSLALSAGACTKSEDKPEDKPALEAPGAIEEEKPIARDYPETTIMAASVVNPGQLLDSLVEQSSPGYDWRAKIDGIDPAILKGFDLAAPMDLLVGYVPKTPEGQRFAMSFGVTDAASYEAALKAMKLTPTNADGVVSFTEAKMTCELPKDAKRVHCWEGERTRAEEYITAIDARKAPTGAPRMEMIVDGDYFTGPLKPDVDGTAAMARVFGPNLLEEVKDPQLKTDATQMLNDTVDGTVAFIEDIDRLEITMGLLKDNQGTYMRGRLRLDGRKSTVAKLLSPKFLKNGPAPAEMMALPADVNSASYAHVSLEQRPGEVESIQKLVVSTLTGLAREGGVYDPTLDTFLELAFKSNTTPYTLTVQPRTPPPEIKGPEDLGNLQSAPVIVVSPKTDNNQGAIFDALVAYVESQPVKAVLDPLLGQLGKDALVIDKAADLGAEGRRIHLKIDNSVTGNVFGTGENVEFEVLYTEDDKNTYWAFGSHPDLMRDYIKRTMAGEGPTLADDPRAAYLKDENAFSATFTPIDPTYIADFATQIFASLDPSMDPEAKDFKAMIDKVAADWKKLPASAVRSRMLSDEDGLLWEASTPPPVMRMFGDALRAGIETFQKKQAAKGADPIDPVQMP